ncbi:MAG: hypothetical protein LBF62_15240 [Tannerellaceae bacterium]|jgi:hypothetical protein|nr:hypothetical protein [Tannerellaceae bacterium]
MQTNRKGLSAARNSLRNGLQRRATDNDRRGDRRRLQGRRSKGAGKPASCSAGGCAFMAFRMRKRNDLRGMEPGSGGAVFNQLIVNYWRVIGVIVFCFKRIGE